MAWTEFYVQSGGSNVNAGSTTANAALVTVTNGSWDITADTFIGTSGIEFAATAVGEWASIYIDGATVAVYVAQVTAVGALGVSITLSTTAKYGTKPAASATARSCKTGGAWASELPWASGGLGSTTIPASTRVNVKQATYTIVASRTFSLAGTTTAPFWVRGYHTTLGDCDADPTLARPIFAYNATFAQTISGSDHLWSSVTITGSISSQVLIASGNRGRFLRLRVTNTSANAAAFAVNQNGGHGIWSYCYFTAPTTGTSTSVVNSGVADITFVGCVVEGGGKAAYGSANNWNCFQCIALNNTGNGWLTATGRLTLSFCTVYNSTGDGIKWTGTPNVTPSLIIGCILSNCGGYGINQASGTNTNLVFRACNDFYSCTSGNENGFGDSPSFFQQAESSSPFVSSTDLSLVAAAVAHVKGFAPGNFENQSYRSTVAIGAVHTDVPAAGGGQGVSQGLHGIETGIAA